MRGGKALSLTCSIFFFPCFYRNSSTKNGESEYLVRKKKRHSQSADPAEVHRMQCATPGMVSHPPIPVNTLGKHVENLKANGGVKFLQEFEVGLFVFWFRLETNHTISHCEVIKFGLALKKKKLKKIT